MAKKTLIIWEDTPGSPQALKFDIVASITHEGVTEVTEHPVEVSSDITDHAKPNNRRLTIEGVVSNTPTVSNTDSLTPGRIRGVQMVPTPPNDYMTPENKTLELGSGPDYAERSRKLDIPSKPLKLGNPVGQAIGGLTDIVKGAVGTSATLLERRGTKSTSAKAFLLTADEFKDRVREMYEALERARINSYLLRVETALGDYENMVIESVTVPRTAANGKSARFNVALREVRIVNAKTVEAPQPAEPLGSIKIAKGSQNKTEDDANKDANKKRSLLRKAADAGFDAIGDLF